ncbi:hypothetical protein CDAR_231431 [Caerostris darwini]|uniref:Ribosomal protein L32 n=1 Tax=Caerostris darwini TaxID=1538125 RepID=A0AAV4PFY8_9ARAC|nr:hypothetical protein CDAR_231431 [Caerostris darwini]
MHKLRQMAPPSGKGQNALFQVGTEASLPEPSSVLQGSGTAHTKSFVPKSISFQNEKNSAILCKMNEFEIFSPKAATFTIRTRTQNSSRKAWKTAHQQ